LPGKDFLVKHRFKRSFIVLLVAAVPFVYAQPVSFSQDLVVTSGSVLPGVSVSMGRLPDKTNEPFFYGTASWYSRSDRGIKKRTASGAIFDHTRRACASWSFPMGTLLRVTNLENGRSVICVVNDRGPAKKLNRLVDLTTSAFREISDLKEGLIRVSVTPLAA
jgi:rare lipoprotein A